MSITTRRPLSMVGGNVFSGAPRTGQLSQTFGGGVTACIWSGALNPNLTGCPSGAVASGGQILLWTGPGRLDTVLPHAQINSGLQTWFYDAAAIALSGVSVSGQRIIGVVPATWAGGIQGSGAINTGAPYNGEPIRPGSPFTSGLCLALPSGCPGVTVTFSPEVVPTDPAQ